MSGPSFTARCYSGLWSNASAATVTSGLTDDADQAAIAASVEAMVKDVQAYVPGYRLKQAVQFERIGGNAPLHIPEMGENFTGLKVTIFLEVEGAGHYLPAYAGNLDIMTSAALKTVEKIALRFQERITA